MNLSGRTHGIVWAIAVVMLLIAGFSSIEFTIDDRPPVVAMYWAFAVSISLSMLAIFIEAKRDLFAVSMFRTAVSSIVAIITGSIWKFGIGSHPVAATVAVLASAVFLLCIGYAIRAQFGSEIIQNHIRQQFNRSGIYEVDGVQFVAQYGPSVVPAGESFNIVVLVQNCWSEPRTFRFDLATKMKFPPNMTKLIYEPASEIQIPAASVATLTIPCLCHPKSGGHFSLIADPSVQGNGGVRVRKWRAQGLARRVPPWLTAIGPGFGFIVWGGGLAFDIEVRPSNSTCDAETNAQQATKEVIWQPDPQLLSKAIGAA